MPIWVGVFTILALWLFYLFAPPGIGPKLTREGFIACESEETLREGIRAAKTPDDGYFFYLVYASVCRTTDAGERVIGLDSGWFLQDWKVVPWVKYRRLRRDDKAPVWARLKALENMPPEN